MYDGNLGRLGQGTIMILGDFSPYELRRVIACVQDVPLDA